MHACLNLLWLGELAVILIKVAEVQGHDIFVSTPSACFPIYLKKKNLLSLFPEHVALLWLTPVWKIEYFCKKTLDSGMFLPYAFCLKNLLFAFSTFFMFFRDVPFCLSEFLVVIFQLSEIYIIHQQGFAH